MVLTFAWLSVPLSLLCFAGGRWASTKYPAPPVQVVSALCVAPWLFFCAYYLHIMDFIAYYEWRSWPLTDLTPALVGIPLGALAGAAATRYSRRNMGLLAAGMSLSVAATLAAHARPWLRPLDVDLLQASWSDGVCLQSTATTCGVCSTATVLRPSAMGRPR